VLERDLYTRQHTGTILAGKAAALTSAVVHHKVRASCTRGRRGMGKLGPTLFMQLLQGATLGMTQIGVAAFMRQHIPPRFLWSAAGTYAASWGLSVYLRRRAYLRGQRRHSVRQGIVCIGACYRYVSGAA
jgi:hypothetical protein